MTKMDHPTSPSPVDRPAKRQCRVSHAPEDEPKLENQPQQVTNGTTIEPKIPVRTRGTLTAEFMKVLNLNDSLATPALKLLDLYFCLWECYVVKSAQKIRLEEEQRQLQASNDLLASDSDILLQLCNVQASVLWERKRTVQALCNGVVSALEASDLQAYSARSLRIGKVSMCFRSLPTHVRSLLYTLPYFPTAFDGQSYSRNERLNENVYDLDLDLHAIWYESSGIPTPPPCLATDPNDLWQDSFGKDDLQNTNSRAFLDRMPFLSQSRQSVRVQVDRSRSSD
ncbi:unnamed protein product [Penicillium nalgiovense]|nr:unnamed protein product [Penicillium nalgiovense]